MMVPPVLVWEFHTTDYRFSTEWCEKHTKKHPSSDSSLGRHVMVIREVRGKWPYWWKWTGRWAKKASQSAQPVKKKEQKTGTLFGFHSPVSQEQDSEATVDTNPSKLDRLKRYRLVQNITWSFFRVFKHWYIRYMRVCSLSGHFIH